MWPKFQEIEPKLVKIKAFPARPRPLFAVSQSVSQKNRPHCPKANVRKSFPGQKPRPSRVSLVSLGLVNVAQVQGNRVQVGQNQS